MKKLLLRSALLVACWVLLSFPTPAAEPFRYPEGKHGKAELKYINDLPVLTLEGTPEQIGEQVALLTSKSATKLLDYPRDVLRRMKLEAMWPALVLTGKAMVPQFPADYLRELETSVKTIGIDRDALIVGNTMFDVMKVAACASLFVEAGNSASHGPLLGRNLDYPTLDYLQDYSMVIVVRPKGKHAFASVGFPGILGCLSGMNDAGLCLAVLETYAAKDGAPKFNAKGTPYAMCYRRILEECGTIEEAEKLLRSMNRTTMNNLAVCDRKGGAVFEITPKSVIVRRPEQGICPCTNHFRTPELASSTRCWRYDILKKNTDRTLSLADVARQLDLVNQGKSTFQTMIFEPGPLKLHLAIGKCPSSALPMKELNLQPMFARSN